MSFTVWFQVNLVKLFYPCSSKFASPRVVTSMLQDTASEAFSSSSSPGSKKKGKGGRKKNLHPPTPTIMKHRRNMANARERKRMNGLNDAFERLREVVPNVNTEQKMSKIETLLVAQTYIKALAKLMDSVAQEEEEGCH